MKFEKKSEKKQTKKTFVYDFNSKSVKNRFFSHLKTVLQKTNIPDVCHSDFRLCGRAESLAQNFGFKLEYLGSDSIQWHWWRNETFPLHGYRNGLYKPSMLNRLGF